MKFDIVGAIALTASIVILLLLLTKTTKEHFTSVKGNYPSWTGISRDVQQTLSKYYTFSVSDYLTYADQTIIGTKDDPLSFMLENFIHSFPIPEISSQTNLIDVDTIKESFANENFKPYLKNQVFDATRPYDMAIILIEAIQARTKAVIQDPSKSANKVDSKASDVVSSYQYSYMYEAVASALRSYAYFYLFQFTSQSNIKITEK
jgi:hypothetical protein